MPDVTVGQMFMWLFGQIVVAAAIWGGIRADVKSIHARLDSLSSAVDSAHKRLDMHLENGRRTEL